MSRTVGVFLFIGAAVLCFLDGSGILPIRNVVVWSLFLIALGLAVGGWWPSKRGTP